MISDLVLVIHKFVPAMRTDLDRLIIMGTYYSAQLLLSLIEPGQEYTSEKISVKNGLSTAASKSETLLSSSREGDNDESSPSSSSKKRNVSKESVHSSRH